MIMSLPLAAGLADLIFPLVVGLITVAGWIINAVKKHQEDSARRNAANKRPKDQRVRREIEEFLQQQQTGRPSRPATIQVNPADIEVVEEPPVRQRPTPVVQPTKTPRSNRKSGSQGQKTPNTPTASTPSPAAATRSPIGQLSHNPLGADLREHVQQAMAERVKSQAERDLPHLSSSIAAKVQEDLGEFSVSNKAIIARTQTSPLVQMLQNPASARQAVLMHEILGRPKALRK